MSSNVVPLHATVHGRPDIPTALTLAEAAELASLAEGKIVLEVGSLLGYSTVVLARVAEHVASVDPHEGYPQDDPKPTLGPFLDNLHRYGVSDKVTVWVGRDDKILPHLRAEYYDLVFIDCTGEYELTAAVMQRSKRLLSPEGRLAVHDCGHPNWQGVRRAVEEFALDHKTGFVLTDRLAVFRRSW